MNDLMNNLGYQFKNSQLLSLALTHPSTRANNSKQMDNQRLEFLGDAVLQLAISQKIYKEYPTSDEGDLSAMRTSLVCRNALVEIAKLLNVGKYLHLGHGMAIMGGRKNEHNLEDAVEAIFAAIYIDGGFEKALEVISNIYARLPHLKDIVPENSKGRLQEYAQAKKIGLPKYELLESKGPDHDKRFSVAVKFDDKVLCVATGKSKKSAEQMAAACAIKKLLKE